MKNKVFVTRLINLLLVVGILLGYQGVLAWRGQSEKIAYLESQLASVQAAGGTAETGSADGTSGYADGTYSGEADGFGGPVKVDVTVSGGNISDITITSAEKEDGAYLDMAKGVIDEIKSRQTTEVDVVSGATFSSNGIINAVKAALEGAQK